MFKGFMGMFKKDDKNKKKEEKEKLPKDLVVDGEKEEADEKQIDELINSNEIPLNNKNNAYFLYLERDDERKIITEVVKGKLFDVNSQTLWEAFLPMLQKWDYSKHKDDYRPKFASKKGGIEFANKEVTKMIRSTGVELIKQIGKKLISGDFNLTTISFPIKCMIPLTILQAIGKSYFNFPVYLNLATLQQDPLERFKFVIIASLSCYFKSSHFLKPMNSILGETYEMAFSDGSKIYLEQSCHHPPISHFYMLGPKKNYKYYGYGNFSAGAGLNSVKVYNKGKRTVEFDDGQKIIFNFCNEAYNNSFFGTIHQESLGELYFKDLKYGFELNFKLGNVKKKPSDYFHGEIKLKNIVVSKVFGSFCSYIEFNNIRYWDVRDNLEVKVIEPDVQLPSSAIYREDRILIEKNNVETGQKVKEKLEELQRADRKLRHLNEKQNKK